MRKTFLFLMSVAMLGMVSCTSCKHEKPVFAGYDFETVVAGDHETMVGMFGDEVRFYEAQVWYSQNFDSVESNHVAKIRTVFQSKDTSISVFHVADASELAELFEYAENLGGWYTIDTNETDYTFTLFVRDFWIEDQKISLDSVKITLDSALNVLRGLERPLPQSKFVVMRQPLFPPFPTHPSYIFGDMANCVAIDSQTGKVVAEY